jgi:hypothetical protein
LSAIIPACRDSATVFGIQQALAHAQITTKRYVHWARGLADSAAHRLPIEIA